MPPSAKSFCERWKFRRALSAAAWASSMAAREAARSSGLAPFWKSFQRRLRVQHVGARLLHLRLQIVVFQHRHICPLRIGSPSFTETSFSRPTTRDASLISCEVAPSTRPRAAMCESILPRETRAWLVKPEESRAIERRNISSGTTRTAPSNSEHVDIAMWLSHKSESEQCLHRSSQQRTGPVRGYKQHNLAFLKRMDSKRNILHPVSILKYFDRSLMVTLPLPTAHRLLPSSNAFQHPVFNMKNLVGQSR